MTQANSEGRCVALRFRDFLAVVVVLTFSLQGLVHAAAAKEDAAKQTDMAQKPAGPREISRSVAGVIVTIDPATGKLKRPTPEEARQLAAGFEEMVSQSAEGLVVVHHFNGMMSVNLEDRFQNVSVARVNPDGSIALGCVSDPQSAEAFLQGGPAEGHARDAAAKAPAPRPAKNAAGKE